TVLNNSTGGNGMPTEWVVVQGGDPCGDYSGNLTGGTGFFVVANSDCPGSGVVLDTTLITPSVDMTSFSSAAIPFNEDYRSLSDNADVDVSNDGGSTRTEAVAEKPGPRWVRGGSAG